jgi:myo-inositol-1(or 4)-monophosphatase
MPAMDPRADVARITEALTRAGALLLEFFRGGLDVEYKSRRDPVTEADRAADRLLYEVLRAGGDGWLSEERRDEPTQRLDHSRVWIVDPLDGTREFVDAIPEWCVSIGLVEDGRPVAGGIHNPAAGHLIVGAVGHGVTHNGTPVVARPCPSMRTAEVLASNSEVARGEWNDCCAEFHVRSIGSVAYKLGLVAAGLGDATWTFTPKHEWDVAGGAALILASGGRVFGLDGGPVTFNRPNPRLPGFVAFSAAAEPVFRGWFESRWKRGPAAG